MLKGIIFNRTIRCETLGCFAVGAKIKGYGGDDYEILSIEEFGRF